MIHNKPLRVGVIKRDIVITADAVARFDGDANLFAGIDWYF